MCCNHIGDQPCSGGGSCFLCFQGTGYTPVNDTTEDPQPFGGNIVVPAGTLKPGMIIACDICFDDLDHTLPTNNNNVQIDLFAGPTGSGIGGAQLNAEIATFTTSQKVYFNFGNSGCFFGATVDAIPNACIMGGITTNQENSMNGYAFPHFTVGYRIGTNVFTSDAVIFTLDPTIDNEFSWWAEASPRNAGLVITPRITHLWLTHGAS